MLLTSVVAVIMTIAIRINAPKIAQGLFAGYLVFFGFWIVIRGPRVFAELMDVNARRRQLKQRRTDMERELIQLRQIRYASDIKRKSNDDEPLI